MTKAELIQQNNDLVSLLRDVKIPEEGMTATDMFFWTIAISVIGTLLVWLGSSIKNTMDLKVQKMIEETNKQTLQIVDTLKGETKEMWAIQNMHIEELKDVQQKQLAAGEERKKIWVRLENHDTRIKQIEK